MGKWESLEEAVSTLTTTMDGRLNEMRSDLAGHETEHESIINEIIHQMDAIKTSQHSLVNHPPNGTVPDAVSKETVQEMLEQNAMAIREDLKEMVHSKWSKVEKVMNKVLNDVHKWRRHKSSGPIARRAATDEATPSQSPIPSAPSSHHHHHTIISVDLENLNSHHTNVQNVHPNAVPKPPTFAGYGKKGNPEKVKMIKSTAAHRNKRRVRSVSLDPTQMEHSGKRTIGFRTRPSSHGGRS